MMPTHERMKIALVGLTHPFRGGISHYTTLLCRALREKHEVRFFSLKRQYPGFLFPGATQMDNSAVPFQVANTPCLDSMNPLSWIVTFNNIRKFEPDFILFSWWHPFFAPAFGSVAFLAGIFARIPSCYLCHNVFPHDPSPLDKILLRYAFFSARVFITHSQTDADNLKRLRPAALVHKASHPSYDAFASMNRISEPDAKARLGLTGKRVLLFFGFVRKYKGLHCLLEAMAVLEPEEGYHLLVVGEFYQDKKEYSGNLDLLAGRNQITLVDRYVPNEDVPLYFSAADLVVLPALTATQSGIIQIARGFLKPVIATNVGGLPEAIADGKTGFLVPPSDPKALAMAIRNYFSGNRKEDFQRNIAREKAAHSWDRMVQTITEAGMEAKRERGNRRKDINTISTLSIANRPQQSDGM